MINRFIAKVSKIVIPKISVPVLILNVEIKFAPNKQIKEFVFNVLKQIQANVWIMKFVLVIILVSVIQINVYSKEKFVVIKLLMEPVFNVETRKDINSIVLLDKLVQEALAFVIQWLVMLQEKFVMEIIVFVPPKIVNR